MRTLLIATGVAGMLYAVLGLLADPDVQLLGVLVFLVAVLVAHDAGWMPLVLAVGALIRRFVPPRWHRVVRVALVAGATVTVVGLPLALSPGRPADDPSVLPLHYGRNLAIVLAVLAVLALAALARGRKNSARPGAPGDE